MRKARLITIGTEITSGEVVNTNASWVSLRLEDLGVRVFSHLSVRDQREEILKSLQATEAGDLVIVTGGLGPTSDDLTRACVAEHCGLTLEFDEGVWTDLSEMYRQRQLPLLEAHKHQCYFPEGSVRLSNPAGSALGFYVPYQGRDFFVLPGPPRELESMWQKEVEPRLKASLPETKLTWVRWTCLGAPESEVAELVEKIIEGLNLEVGYRAQVPYVKVKLYLDPEAQSGVIEQMERALAPFIVARGWQDLAEEVIERWPGPELHVFDALTESALFARLLLAKKKRGGPRLSLLGSAPGTEYGITLTANGEEFVTQISLPSGQTTERQSLPYKVKLDSERGHRSAVEWALWTCVRALRAQPSTSST